VEQPGSGAAGEQKPLTFTCLLTGLKTAWYWVFIDVFILSFGRWKSELRYGKSQSQADKWKNAVRGIRFVDVNPRYALIERTLITLTRLLLRTLEKDMVKFANLIKPN